MVDHDQASAAQASAPAPADPFKPTQSAASPFGLFAIASVVAITVALAWAAWGYYFDTPWTRDGTVRVYTAQVAAEVSGRVTEVLVSDNQRVRKGDVLFRIDDRDYRIAVKRAEAAVAQARAQAANSRAEADRRNQLSDLAVSPEVRQTYESNADAAAAAVEAAAANLENARVNLDRVAVLSPVNGFVSNLLLQAGTYATAGQPAMTLINSDSYWVAGYFEETQIRTIRVGDPARIVLMGYSDQVLDGRVDSLARGIMDPNAAPGVAGLPNVNPVFTWVRLAQRIPIRITFSRSLPDNVHLAAGMTATIQIGRQDLGEARPHSP